MSGQKNISVAVGGDFCPVGRPETDFLNGSLNSDAINGSLRNLYAECDIGVVNMECPFTVRGKPIKKSGACMRANPEMIELLTCLGVHVVSLANNHIRDYGSEGVLDTLDLCAAKGIRTVGAGRNLKAARQPLYMPVNGRTVAFVNVAEKEFGSATSNHAGGNPLDLSDLLSDLRHAQSQAKHVILIVHGGLELMHFPSPESVRMLRFLAEQGVTAVVRHHSHYVQGYEVWKGVPIFYGLGNMLFDLDTPMDAGWYQGLIVSLKIDPKNECTFDLHPISQCKGRISIQLLEGNAKAMALRSIFEYSELLADEAALLRAWESALEPMKEDYFSKLIIPAHTARRIVRRLGLMRFVRPGKWTSQYLVNVLRCDAHREALIDILEKEQSL